MPIRVAIVDDHRLVREGLAKILAADPEVEVVGEAGRGDETVRLVRACSPDVLLLDIALPDVDGLTVAERVTAACPQVRVLMLSMHAESEYGTAALERGAHGLVGKTASPERLLKAIRTVASGAILPVEGGLSPREREVLALVASGATNEEIADRLGIRPRTVAGHCERLMAKLDVHTRAGLLAHGRRVGLSRADISREAEQD